MRGTRTMGMAIAAAVVLIVGVVSAQPPFHGPGHHPGFGGRGLHRADFGPGLGFGWIYRVEAYADEIGLSDKQVDEIKSIRTKFEKDLIDLRADRQKAQVDFHDLIWDPDAKSSEIEKVATKIADLDRQIHLKRVEMALQIRDVLTPEQREKVIEALEEHRAEVGPGFGEGRREGPGLHRHPGGRR